VLVLSIYVEATRLKRIGETAHVTANQQAVECYTHIDPQTYRRLQQKLKGHVTAKV
jgi:hypothetical protein